MEKSRKEEEEEGRTGESKKGEERRKRKDEEDEKRQREEEEEVEEGRPDQTQVVRVRELGHLGGGRRGRCGKRRKGGDSQTPLGETRGTQRSYELRITENGEHHR